MSGGAPKKVKGGQQQLKGLGNPSTVVQQPSGVPTHGCPGTHQTQYDCNTISAIANIRQADAAEWFNHAAVVEIGVGLVTAVVAFFAAKFAADAVKAARENLAHDKDIARAELRPWLLADRVDIGNVGDDGSGHPNAGGIYFQVLLRNFGSRPATKTFVFCDLKAAAAEDKCPPFADPVTEDQHGFAGPSGITLSGPLGLPPAIVETWKKRDVVFWLRCVCRYAEPNVAGRPYLLDVIYLITFQGMGQDNEGRPLPRFQGKMEFANLK